MKCAARAVSVMERYNFQHRKYGELLLDHIEAAAVYCAAQAYRSLRSCAAMQNMLDCIQEWMLTDVTNAVPETLRMKDGGRSWWASEVEREDDAIRSALWRWEREWRDYGFRDVNLSELDAPPIYGSYSLGGMKTTDPNAFGEGAPTAMVRDARIARSEYMRVRGSDIIRLYTICYISWLAEQEFTTGKKKFSVENIEDMVYKPYAAEVRSLLRDFLDGSHAGTLHHEARMHEMEKWIRDNCGFILESVAEKEARVMREEAEKKTEGMRAGPDPFADILSEVSGSGFGGVTNRVLTVPAKKKGK